MERQGRLRAPFWFYLVAVVLLLWGVMGVVACVQQVRLGAEAMGPASDYDRQLYAALPGWYNVIYAVAVGSGFLGAAALLARSPLARALFIVSVVAVAIQFGWLFAATDIIAAKGAATVLPFPILILGIAIVEVWFADYARRRGWIG
ncbi:hypothetical protein SAMN06297144_2451 [Sphingomonas guangdongensis]|uniref:Sugar transporter n=1 Tax=Sphingomonas guangdongensis TaxID=1141890 RepID=A0A285QZN5_9SPHN|nr:hypothetical protein [Sphingomonas guangdongensis]SOB87321.1 hypothetical protein SAMN06297144_2451 [Sphingomonas guangdongensis]